MKMAFFMWTLIAPLQALPNAVLGALDSLPDGEEISLITTLSDENEEE